MTPDQIKEARAALDQKAGWGYLRTYLSQALDALEELERETEGLRVAYFDSDARALKDRAEKAERERDEARRLHAPEMTLLSALDTATARSKAAEARVRELEGALRQIVAIRLPADWMDCSCKQCSLCVARAALSHHKEPSAERPTHRCKICGALWRLAPVEHPFAKNQGYFWSLHSPTCGKCCDNVEMREQIEPLTAEPDPSK